MMSQPFCAPHPLAGSHRLEDFECGEPMLDEWLRRRAMANQSSGASRTFVVTRDNDRVVGYYVLAAGAISRNLATPAVRRNMPEPVPVLVLGRLAVDRSVQGGRLGAAMLQDAVNRAVAVSEHAGIRALLVHALNDRAVRFYKHYGFQASHMHPMTLMLRLNAAKL